MGQHRECFGGKLNVADAVCKVCGDMAPLHGVVDFNRCCEIGRKRFLPLAGVPVWYHRCQNCEFLFTTQFDHWTPENWRSAVYNDGYAAVDPDGADGTRARINAEVVMPYQFTRLLDYGGGDGAFARDMRRGGRDAISWEPFRGEVRPEGDFDFVTAFEVMEHSPTPHETVREMMGCLRAGGVAIFSTMLMDGLEPFATDHWYIAPRNGHVSLHTSRSLARLFWPEWNVVSLSSGYHRATAA